MTFINKRWHGIPVWALGAGAVGAVVIGYRYYKSRHAAKAKAATGTPAGAATAVTPARTPYVAEEMAVAGRAPTGASITLPTGGTYTGPAKTAGLITKIKAPTPPAPTAPPTPAAPPQPAQTGPTGSELGYNDPSGAAVTGSTGGSFVGIPNWGAAQSIISGGGTVYYEPALGVFMPANSGASLLLPPGTSTGLFAKT